MPAYSWRSIDITPPLWRDLVKILTRKPRHASSFALECTDFKNVTFEVTEVAEVKRLSEFFQKLRF